MTFETLKSEQDLLRAIVDQYKNQPKQLTLFRTCPACKNTKIVVLALRKRNGRHFRVTRICPICR